MAENPLRVPTFCPCCSMLMKGPKSIVSFYEHGCCVFCKMYFVEGREERWLTGWRPDAAAIAAMSEKIDSY